VGKIFVPSAVDFPQTADLIVIGGGITGVATAFFASRVGLDTVVLERRDGLGTLTTAASQECFRAQFSEPENVAMMKASIALFEHFDEVVGLPGYDIGLHQQGYLFMSGSPKGPERLRARVAHQHHIGLEDVEYLDGDEVRRRFPWAGPNVTAATFRAKDGWLSAHELVQGFARGSVARFLLRTEAQGILRRNQEIIGVLTNRGPISTGAVVIAAGPFSGVVAKMAGVDLPLSIVRRQKVIIGANPLIPADAPMTIDDETGAHWRPEVDGAAMSWAVPEEPREPTEHVPTDWTFPALVIEAVARLSPFWWEVGETLKREDVFLSAGLYTYTPDHKPIIGGYPDVKGLYLNVGYSGHGVMGSPEGSRLLVDLITGRISEEENPFSYARFTREEVPTSAERMII